MDDEEMRLEFKPTYIKEIPLGFRRDLNCDHIWVKNTHNTALLEHFPVRFWKGLLRLTSIFTLLITSFEEIKPSSSSSWKCDMLIISELRVNHKFARADQG